MIHDVVAQTVVGFAGQGVGAGFGVHQSGGDHKPLEFVSAQIANSLGKNVGGAHRIEGAVSAHVGEANEMIGAPVQSPVQSAVQSHADAPTQKENMSLVPMEPAAPSIPALVPLGTGGRPKVLTPETTEKLYMLLSVGFSRRQASAYLGLSPSAIPMAASRNPEFAAELRRAEELTALQSEMTIMAEARKNWKAAAWYLTFKLKNPPPLTEEEKEERHQAKLADNRRRAAEMQAYIDATRGPAVPSPFDRSALDRSSLGRSDLPGMPKVERKPRRGK